MDPNSEPRADPLVGKVVHDRFRIIAPIARGGMGAVYKAEQAPLGRLVALKVLSPKHDEGKDPEFRKRFFLEAATVAKLSHPNTVTVFDYGQSENVFFIVMELLSGMTLKKAIKETAPFPAARGIHIAKQIVRSLREAHRLGVIHRDMKPGNVMLLEQGDEQDYVKVLDFGLVKDLEQSDEDDLTQTGVFMGSPKYMSPEQIQGEAVDGRSDIYSVGILLYEMLVGKPPFVRDKQVQVLMDHIHAPVPPLEPEGTPPVPPELQQIVLKCLAKKPDDRFADMEHLLIALKTAAGELALAMPPSMEMGTTGDFPTAGGTPVSGIHSLGPGGVMASPVAGIPPASISGTLPPTQESYSSTSGQIPLGPHASQAMAAQLSTSQPVERGGSGKLAFVFGLLAIVAALAIVLIALNPFADDPAPLPPEPAPMGTFVPEPVPEVAPDPTPPPEPEPEIRSVLVELDSTPPGAMVRIGDQRYGPTPAQVELTGDAVAPGAELTMVFRLAGYRDMTVSRHAPAEGNLSVQPRLRRMPRTRRGSSSDQGSGGTTATTPAGYRDSPY